jgi:methylmalonyl-CoA mutase cobalamin-binding subunit
MSSALAMRLPRRALVVLAGRAPAAEGHVRALVESLNDVGIDATYLGREVSASEIATAVAERGADAVELCLGAGGTPLIRSLLRELIDHGRRDVRIVVHRIR